MGNYYTIKQAAKMLGITPQTLLKWIVTGVIPGMLFGKEYMISKKAISYYLKYRKGKG